MLTGRQPQAGRVRRDTITGQPKPPPLEGIRRQLDKLRLAYHSAPIQVHTGDKPLRDGVGQRRRLGAILAQRRHRCHHNVGQRLFDRRNKATAGPDFEESAASGRLREAHTVGEPHGLPDVTSPVGR
ncbi:Uncharacterised protein [Mycobacterium tuberculosis]|uniref:Uncharacterized protein n=1 Tax=Mycobacterium tuberculosis TaxID=1773 RepID=A0A655JNW4_MYCTX|nr:Uncharacterised protein [Mycobacterium tuberculosis]COX31384.1 Uncharacterised protein [Mycobacterium tuberculosis]